MDLLTVNHIEPRSKGGSDHINNFQLVCQKCNSAKGNKSYEEAIATQWKKDGAMWEKRSTRRSRRFINCLEERCDRKQYKLNPHKKVFGGDIRCMFIRCRV